MSIAVESRILDQTCKFCTKTGCKLNISTMGGCPIACIAYKPNNKTKVKRSIISNKYSFTWVSSALVLAAFFEVIHI